MQNKISLKFIAKYASNEPRGILLIAFRLALICAIAYAFYTGFRAPGLWTSNYWQVSFADGFFRRALIGTLLLPLGCERFDYFTIEAIQFVVLSIALALFVYLGVKCREYITLCGFFISAAGGYFFHEAGYAEQFLWMFAAAAIAALHANKISWFCYCACNIFMAHQEV